MSVKKKKKSGMKVDKTVIGNTLIDKEVKHYLPYFQNKTIYCNEQILYDYFSRNFQNFGLTRIIFTSYNKFGSKSYYKEYDGVHHSFHSLNGKGDFCSRECKKLVKQSDIIVTNAPKVRTAEKKGSELFREYVTYLLASKKKFLIIGLKRGFSDFEIGKLFVTNNLKVRLGYTNSENNKESFNAYQWYTNMSQKKRNYNTISLTQTYYGNENKYPRYENDSDIIHVKDYRKAPKDYDGLMGVAWTYCFNHNPNQFEIVDFKDLELEGKNPHGLPRFVIKHKNPIHPTSTPDSMMDLSPLENKIKGWIDELRDELIGEIKSLRMQEGLKVMELVLATLEKYRRR